MNLRILSILPAAFAAGLCLTPPPAQAQAFDAVRLYGGIDRQDRGVVGLAVIGGREYQGSDESRTLVVPVLDYQWANGWFAGFTNGIGYNFAPPGSTKYGLRLTADLGRKERRSEALRGMGDIDATAEIGGFFNYALPQGFFFTSSLRYGSGDDNKGMLVDLGVGYGIALAPQWRLGFGVATTWANSDYMQSYFGVTPVQAGRTSYLAYEAGSGMRDARANAALTYQMNSNLSLTGAISSSRLGGDARDSPLTRERTTTSVVAALDWSF